MSVEYMRPSLVFLVARDFLTDLRQETHGYGVWLLLESQNKITFAFFCFLMWVVSSTR